MEADGHLFRQMQLKHVLYRWRAQHKIMELGDKVAAMARSDKNVALRDRFQLSFEILKLKNDLFDPKQFFNRRFQNKHVADMREQLEAT